MDGFLADHIVGSLDKSLEPRPNALQARRLGSRVIGTAVAMGVDVERLYNVQTLGAVIREMLRNLRDPLVAGFALKGPSEGS
jgi:hypothetical protein